MRTPEQILRESKTIAVVGLSADTFRASFGVAEYMQRAGYRIIPVNPKHTEVLGEKCYRSLRDVPAPVDIVNIFRRPVDVPPVVEDAIAIGAKAVWMQLGIANEAAAAGAREAGIDVVMDRCIMIEHRRSVR